MLRTAFGTLFTLALAAVLGGCGSDSTPVQQDASTQGTQPVGAACTKSIECTAGSSCLTDEAAVQLGLTGVQTYGGYCIVIGCDPTKTDLATCGPNAHCFDGRPYGVSTFVCLATCTGPSDCTRPSYECFTDYPTDAGVQAKGCVPAGLIKQDGGTTQQDAAPDA
ncbi:MAG TPA: hypothetical protein VGQ83_14515 [Polyangia bacterium]|jgi:hypothetical protein